MDAWDPRPSEQVKAEAVRQLMETMKTLYTNNISVEDRMRSILIAKDQLNRSESGFEPPPCEYVLPNGDRYEGDRIITENGSIERTGEGMHVGVDGLVYYGSWQADRMHGEGRLLLPSGACYEGDFVDNQFHGHGKYTWPDNSYYSGQFVENGIEGEGEFVDTEGHSWTGLFAHKSAKRLPFKLAMS